VSGSLLEPLIPVVDTLPEESIPKLQAMHKVLLIAIYGTEDPSQPANKKKEAITSDKDREKAYKLLIAITRRLNNAQELLRFIGDIHRNITWRSYNIIDWNIWYTDFQANVSGYVGLENMSNTCYANAAIQQLFFIEAFRDSVIFVEHSKGTLNELAKVFVILKENTCVSFCPKAFYENMKVVPGVTRLAGDFLRSLFNNLENDFHDTTSMTLLNEMIEISFSRKTVCTRCEEVEEKTNSLYVLQLDIENFNSLDESLQDYTKTRNLNEYTCPKCEGNSRAQEQVALIEFPQVFFIELKRFITKPETGAIKLNKYFEFPLEIDMGNISYEKSDTLYIIKGIIMHIGTVDKGHYYSLIRTWKDNKWLKFDDKSISKLDHDKVYKLLHKESGM
jgi:ubiquitin C-terminal hydrolase